MLELSRWAKHGEERYFFAALGISFLIFLIILIEPLGSANAVLQSMGLDLVRYGRMPYIGSWDNNFPGIVFLHAIGILLLGGSRIAFRIFDVLIEIGFAIFFFKFLSRWLRPHAAALSVILYAAYYVGTSNIYGQQDPYGMMLIFMGAAVIIPRDGATKGGMARIVTGAAIAGLSFLMRPTFLLFIGFLGLYLLGQTDIPVPSRVVRALLYAGVAMVPTGILLLLYCAIPGGVNALYTSTIRFNLDLYTKLAGSPLWIEIVRSGLMIPLALTAFALKATEKPAIFRETPSRNQVALFSLFVVGGLFVAILMGKNWRSHYAPFYMSIVPFSAIGLECLVLRVNNALTRHYMLVGCVLLSTFIGYNPEAPLAFALALIQHHNPWAAADDVRRPWPQFGAKAERETVAYFEKPENQTGAIEFCGFDPYLRMDLARPFVSRYTTFHALAFRTDYTDQGTPHYTTYQKKWQADYVLQLEQARPRFIVLGRGMPFWYIRDIYTDCLRYLPGFDNFFQSNYRYDTAFGGFQIYQRRK